jgi:acylphosphatase
MKRFSIHVTGKVQGVFFRASAKEKAEALSITGTAHNNADGSVSIEAEGEDEPLMRFVEWCKKGPPLSRVDRCEIEEGHVRHFKEFSVKRG